MSPQTVRDRQDVAAAADEESAGAPVHPQAGALREQSRAARMAAQNTGADDLPRWAERNRYYYGELARLFRLHVWPGSRVLHVGCGLGDVLAAVEPRDGL